MSLDLNKSPPFPYEIISLGPLAQSLDIIFALFIADSTKTKPGSSHKEDKIKPLDLDKI